MQLVGRDLLVLEVLHHEVFVVLDDALDEGGAELFGGLLEVGRHLAGLPALAEVGLHRKQVDDAAEVVALADGEEEGGDGRAPLLADGVEHDVEVRVLPVEAVDEDGAGKAALLGDLPDAVGADLGPGDGIDDDEGEVRGANAADDLGDEVGIPGGVDEVDLGAVPLNGEDGEVEAELAAMLILVVVADRVLLLDGAHPRHRPAHEQGRLAERRLADVAVPDENNVANVFGGVELHRRAPRGRGGRGLGEDCTRSGPLAAAGGGRLL